MDWDALEGVNEVAETDELKVSPNPFHDWIQVSLPLSTREVECRMFDMLGRDIPLRIQRTATALRIEPLGNLPTGVYVLQADIDALRATARVMHW